MWGIGTFHENLSLEMNLLGELSGLCEVLRPTGITIGAYQTSNAPVDPVILNPTSIIYV